ncbi:predicted protein [Postia placenta Mad-698-R]|nr:predicted protein [Postia placenta Mad-698-R]
MVLDNNWAGRGFVLEGGYWSQDGILGFRIDEEQLSEVFLAFPSRFRGIEIWRRTSDVSVDTSSHSDVHAHSTPIKLSPAEALEFEFEEARSTAAEFPLRHSEEGLRGRYTPHACIGAPPNFALASILECVVMDLDVTESYISVCFPSAVVIVPRCEEVKPGTGSASKTTRILVHAEDRPPQLYQEIGMESGKPPGVSRSWVAPETRHPTGVSLTWVAGANALAEMEVAPPWEGLLTGDPRAFYSPLIAARFSPDGRHLAAINAFGLLYLVLNFTRVGHEIVSFSDKVTRTALWTIWDPSLLGRVVRQRAPHDGHHLDDQVEDGGVPRMVADTTARPPTRWQRHGSSPVGWWFSVRGTLCALPKTLRIRKGFSTYSDRFQAIEVAHIAAPYTFASAIKDIIAVIHITSPVITALILGHLFDFEAACTIVKLHVNQATLHGRWRSLEDAVLTYAIHLVEKEMVGWDGN